jgi:hypothetical protein
LDVVDSWDCFESSTIKWEKKFASMMGFGHNTHVKNGSTCKEKWATIYGDYKRIQDYMGVTSQNEHFWNMFATNKLASNLLKLFNKSVFEMINLLMNSPLITIRNHGFLKGSI